MTSECGRSVVQVLVVRVDIGVVTYESMTPQCGRSVVQVLVVKVAIGVVTYESMTPQWGRSVVHVMVVRVDTEMISIFHFESEILSMNLILDLDFYCDFHSNYIDLNFSWTFTLS